MKKYVGGSYGGQKNKTHVPVFVALILFIAVAGTVLFKENNTSKYSTFQANQAGMSAEKASSLHLDVLSRDNTFSTVSKYSDVEFSSSEILKREIVEYAPNAFKKELVKKESKTKYKILRKKTKKQSIKVDSMGTALDIAKSKTYSFFTIVETPDTTGSQENNIRSKKIQNDSIGITQLPNLTKILDEKILVDSLSYSKETDQTPNNNTTLVGVDDIKNHLKNDTLVNQKNIPRPSDEFEDFVFPEIQNDIWETQEKMYGNNVAEIDMNDMPEKYQFTVISKIQEGRMDKLGNSTERGDAIKIIVPEKSGQHMIVKVWTETPLSFLFLNKEGNEIEKGNFETKKIRLFLKHSGSVITIKINQNDSNNYDTTKYKIEIMFMESRGSDGGNSPPRNIEAKTLI